MSNNFAFANVTAGQTDASLTLGDGSGNPLVAVPGYRMRVVAVIALSGGVATTVVFNSKGSGAGTAISSVFANAANSGFVLPFSPVGWFETAVGEKLTVTTGAGATTAFQVVYALLPG